LNELKENLKLQETKQLEEKEEFKSLYEGLKIENEKLKPIVENFEIQEKQRREHLLSQLSDDDQDIYQDLTTIKLEKHIERLGKSKVQISDAKKLLLVASSLQIRSGQTYPIRIVKLQRRIQLFGNR